ncbi:hypothetical protein ABES02_29035 [Neobacillus pocheonensis]|uniref:hypothetical protein n=1 Tax=Neobacillus pocheonensis TaxID=363869 RepID=UPI003D287A0D
MSKPFTKPVIIDPYYDCPSWIDSKVIRKEYVTLSEESKDEDVVLFLILLFGYNNIEVKQSLEDSFNELFNEDQVAISGGIAFFEDQNKKILPSCCCGLEDWNEVYHSVRSKSSPWLGHDPNPGIIYQGNYVRVWSDDPDSSKENKETKEKLYFIEYEYEELLKCLDKTKEDLINFNKGPLFKWIYSRNNEIGNKMTQKMEQWFLSDFDK